MPQANPLTESKLRRLPSVDKDTLHGIGDGLYLRQSATGRLTWLFRTKSQGHTQKRKLGVWPAMSMAAAKAEAAKLSHAGMPDNARTKDLANDWFEKVIEPNYRKQANAAVYCDRLIREFGHRNIGTLTTAELVKSLGNYGTQFPVAANRCRATWSLIFQYAKERGLVDHNPLAGTSNRIAGGKEKARERVLTDDEIRQVMDDGHEHGALLRALLLTGCRISELQAAQTDDIDGDVLRIPDNKSKRPHFVGLAPLVREQFGDYDGYLFEPRSNTAVQSRLKRSRTGWTPHDLRRTFVTRLAGMGIALHVIEKCVNHSLDGMLAIYNREEYRAERIAAIAQWCQEVQRICSTAA
jgi:integrase